MLDRGGCVFLILLSGSKVQGLQDRANAWAKYFYEELFWNAIELSSGM